MDGQESKVKPPLGVMIGEAVRMTRQRRRLTQAEVARLARTGAKQVVHLETGKPVNLETAERVVAALNIDVTIVEPAA